MASYPLGTYGDLLALAMDPTLCRVSVSDVLRSDISELSGMINQMMLDKTRNAEASTPIWQWLQATSLAEVQVEPFPDAAVMCKPPQVHQTP